MDTSRSSQISSVSGELSCKTILEEAWLDLPMGHDLLDECRPLRAGICPILVSDSDQHFHACRDNLQMLAASVSEQN